MMPMGRPTKYTPDMPQKLLDYFKDTKTFEEYKMPDGKTRMIPGRLPTFERFAVDNDVVIQTLLDWCKAHEDFLEAYNKAKHLQKEFLNHMAMIGVYNPTYTAFVAKNITDMRDKQEIDHNNPDGKLTPAVITLTSPEKKPE